MRPAIYIKRVYENPLGKDGLRVLVDRLWPRGVTKDEASIDEWAKDLAPSPCLRKWFNHDPKLWPEFQKKYEAELSKSEAPDAFMKSHHGRKAITLVYAGKDEDHTHSLVLQRYLEEHFPVH